MGKKFSELVKQAVFEYFYPLWLFWQMDPVDKFRSVAMLFVGLGAAMVLILPNINLITIFVIVVIDLFIIYDLVKIFMEQHYREKPPK